MFRKILYIFWLISLVMCICIFAQNANFKNFFSIIENRTFDIRQSVLIKNHSKQVNNSIMLVVIDDASYEYILDRYGEWPIPRDIYAKLINYIEKQNPNSLVFDLMFVKSFKSKPEADKQLIDAVKNNNNIFLSMNFDNQEEDLRVPPQLPKKLSVKVNNKSDSVNLLENSFTNCRKILDGLINATDKIGITNVTRADDGILRKVPVFVQYKGRYYPQLAFSVGLNYLESIGEYKKSDEFVIDNNSNLIIGTRKINIDKDGSVILNWYGANETFTYVPLYKLIQYAEGEHKQPTDLKFNDKIVYFGTTAASLFDVKTVPVSKNYPGVEIQATYLNNMIDNNFIKRLNKYYTISIALILALLTIMVVITESSALVGTGSTITIYLLYIIMSYYAMKYFNLWVDIVYPIMFAIFVFIATYIIKYFIISKDFEQQYKLATTDGLTDLYNHRYFQEQMKLMVDSSARYETQFSLIILDIDFFKQFNDKFGHQAGDAVLRQVAQTLKKNVRASDIVCRYGGEEMSIILANTDYKTAVSTANKICERVSAYDFKLPNGKDASVTISLGVSTYPKDGLTPSELIDAADKHLYIAKNSGRNRVGN